MYLQTYLHQTILLFVPDSSMQPVPDAEIWDLYNENRELLGKDHIRGEQLPIDG